MKNNTIELESGAADFEKPLLLTVSQDLKGVLFNKIGQAVLLLITFTSVLAVFLIFFFIIREAIPFVKEQGLAEFFGSKQWYPEAIPPKFGSLALIAGSFYVTVGAMIFAVPVGLMAAVLLSDIVSFRIRMIFKPIMEILASIPSVAYGFFAVLVVAPWMQKHFGFSTGTNALNASIILAIMAIPTIVSVSEDSLSAIGRDIREASYGLGATRAETMIKVVIPAAHSGIIAAIILGIMRAIGETMVVWMASGNASQIPHPWWDLSQSVRTMTATIAGDMGETVKGSDHYRALFLVGFTLLLFTFILNATSEYFLARVKTSIKGK